MKRIRTIFLSILLLFGVLLASPAQAQETPKARAKPNIIVFLADDFGYECVAANGGKSYQTPNLDMLAARGMRFERCYVQPLCTPTRAQLMTGRYNVRNYINFGTLDPRATTFANLLKRSGYVTCMVGKWQLGHGLNLPRHFGFDEYCLWQHTRRPPRYANPGLEINGKEIDYKNGEYGPELINKYALDFISRKKDEPFLLYYAEMLTHAPFQPTPDSANWDPKAMGEKVSNKKNFADNVSYMDKMIGRLIARLDELKLRENTLFIFLGDNGTGVQITSQLGTQTIKGGKGSTTSAGMHVPLIVNWPGTVAAGKVSQDLIDSTDFLPTVCDVGSVKIPAELKIDGRSFLPQLRGDKGHPRAWFYCWYARDGGAEAQREFAASHQFKLYRSGEFYDYASDPLEKKSIAKDKFNAEAMVAHRMLQSALDEYRNARPAEYKQPAKKKKKDKK
jgi:arylsulfatase A